MSHRKHKAVAIYGSLALFGLDLYGTQGALLDNDVGSACGGT